VNRKLKPLVRPENIASEIILAIWIAESAYEQFGANQFRIKSLADGQHKAGSKHFCGKAVDIALPQFDKDKWQKLADLIQHRLGRYYLVRLEKTYIHVVYLGA